MVIIELLELEKKRFNEIYKLMEAAFPKEELRTYEYAKAQLEKPNYKILVSKNENNKISGFIATWDLGSFIFLEHLAVNQETRGQGLGTKLMTAYLADVKKPVIIEVEDEETEIAKRRVGFYQRLGFHLSEFGYNQPIMRGDAEKKIPLRIMAFPEVISRDFFGVFKKQVFTKIYRTTSES